MGVPPDESQPYGRLKDLIEGLDVFGGVGSSLARLLWGSSYPARKVPRLEEQPARSLD